MRAPLSNETRQQTRHVKGAASVQIELRPTRGDHILRRTLVGLAEVSSHGMVTALPLLSLCASQPHGVLEEAGQIPPERQVQGD